MATRPENEGQRQRIILLVGLLVVLLALVWFFLLRGGGEDEDLTAPAPAPVTTPEVEPTPTPTPTSRGGQVETFDVFAARDPFKPLITAGTGTGATGTAPADGTTAGGDTTTGGDGTTGAGNGSGTGSGNGSGNGNGGQQVSDHTVKLIQVFQENGKDRARVQVDGTVYTVDVGETFAENFKLLSISGRCASILFGDDQFTICEGEQILK